MSTQVELQRVNDLRRAPWWAWDNHFRWLFKPYVSDSSDQHELKDNIFLGDNSDNYYDGKLR